MTLNILYSSLKALDNIVNENILYKTHNLARWKIPANTPSVSMPQIEKLTEKGN